MAAFIRGIPCDRCCHMLVGAHIIGIAGLGFRIRMQ